VRDLYCDGGSEGCVGPGALAGTAQLRDTVLGTRAAGLFCSDIILVPMLSLQNR
jgi:hypothetical protein